MRNIFFASLAALSLAVSSAALHADTFDVSLTVDGAAVIPLHAVTLDAGAVKTYTYTAVSGCVFGLGGCTSLLGVTDSTFNATYVSVSPDLATLSVTDACAYVIVGFNGQAPCSSFAFNLTNVSLAAGPGIGALVDALTLADVTVGIGAGGVNINGATEGPELVAAGLQGGKYDLQFTAATPEPGSLCLLATGALSAAGAMRRKLISRA